MPKNKYGNMFDKNNKYVKVIPYFNFYIDRYSKSAQSHIFNKIAAFAQFCENRFEKNILDMNSLEILDYFKNVIDTKKTRAGEPIKKATKIKYRNTISSYYSFIEQIKELDSESFKNPVPGSKVWDFTGTLYELEDLELEDHLLTMEYVKKIFEYLYYIVESDRIFIAMSLILYSGARVSEVAHIELKNLDIQNRWFITQVKSRKTDKRDGIYFFPEFFIPELETYVRKVRLNYPDSIYLFPVRKTHLHPKTLRKHLRDAKNRLGLPCDTNPHAFRDFINELRIEMRVTKEIRKILLNQKSKDVNISHYAKKFKTRHYLRELYDKSNPFKELIKPNVQL